ncbi:hypothetical protein CCL14_06445 [Pseudomonas syringae]|nr:hypothetical protein CCL14_06445 [Pseudomonas syringae]
MHFITLFAQSIIGATEKRRVNERLLSGLADDISVGSSERSMEAFYHRASLCSHVSQLMPLDGCKLGRF